VDVIAERDGQKLRGFILDALRDLRFTKNRYRLTITLAYNENTYAYSPDGNANRLQILYIANVILRDARGNEIFSQPISTHTNVNIADGHGEVLLALYGRNNSILLRELSNRIIQNIRVFLKNEN
jgi:hypothetical protein